MRLPRALAAAALGCGLTAYAYLTLPDESQLDALTRNMQFWVNSDGQQVSFQQLLYSYPVRLDDISEPLVDATIAMEDSRFFKHPGFDPRGIARAVVGQLTGRRGLGGGSTITQQLAKSLLFSGERSFRRKLREVLLAVKLEKRFSKFEILERYLNRVEYGSGAQGAEAGARFYFNKRARQLNTYEAAMLAGWVPAPSRNNLRTSPQRAKEGAEKVLRRLAATGKLDGPIDKVPRRYGGGSERLRRLDHIAVFDAVAAEVTTVLAGRRGQFVVVTTIEPEVQLYAEHALKRDAARTALRKAGADQAALIALGPDGAIRAMVGSVDRARSQFNRALEGRRQIGSTIKPLVYLAAYADGAEPGDALSGGPIRVDGWSPRNIDGRYPENLTVTEGLHRSVNTAAVRLQEQVGRKRVIALGRALGIEFPLPDKPGLALGLSEATPLQVAQLYNAFATGGRINAPYLLQGVRARRGGLVYWHDTPRAAKAQVAAPALRKLVADLERVTQSGTGRAAGMGGNGYRVAGKTGTTQNHVDAWFAGFTESLTAVVWIGNDDATPTRDLTGGQLPAKVWRRFMLNALLYTRHTARRPSTLPAEPAADKATATDPA